MFEALKAVKVYIVDSEISGSYSRVHEDGDTTLIRNVGKYLPLNTA